MSLYLGDFAAGAIIDYLDESLSGDTLFTIVSGAIAVYRAGDTVGTTAGVTLTIDQNSEAGIHRIQIDLSADAYYIAGYDYFVRFTAGTIDDESVAGRIIICFSIENRFSPIVGELDGRGVNLVTMQRLDQAISTRAAPGAAMTLTSGERSTLAGVLDLAIINQGDGADLIGAIAAAIAQDWIAGDASPMAIVEAFKADALISVVLARIDQAISTRLAASSYTGPNNDGIATLLARLTADRSSYLERLNIGDGNVLAHTGNATSFMADVSGLATLEDISGSGLTSQNIQDIVAALSPTGVTVVSPMVNAGKISIVRGDSYNTAAREISVSAKTANQWSDLTEATIKLHLWRKDEAGTNYQFEAEANPATGSQKVIIELDHSDTEDLVTGLYNASIVASFSDARIETLWMGRFEILDQSPTVNA